MPENEILDVRQEEKARKKGIKHTVNRLVGGVLLYEMLMFVTCMIYIIVKMVPYLLNAHNNEISDAMMGKFIDKISTGGSFYIISIIIGIPFLYWFFRKLQIRGKLLYSKKPMSVKAFFSILCVFMSAQCIFNLLGTGIEAGLNQLGYSILGEIESSSSISTTISMFLYASILGPISEEIIFRGFVLKGLQRYGNRFAIIISAIVFGAFHGNLIQGVFAIMVGLVLGYVATEYSLKWSILLHIINNLIFGDLLGHLIYGFSDSVQTIIINSINAAFLVGTIIIIILQKGNIISYFKSEKTEKGLYRYTFTSVWMIIFLLFQLLLAFSGIEKL